MSKVFKSQRANTEERDEIKKFGVFKNIDS